MKESLASIDCKTAVEDLYETVPSAFVEAKSGVLEQHEFKIKQNASVFLLSDSSHHTKKI